MLYSSRLRDLLVKEPHRRYVATRRARVILGHLTQLIPRDSRILDIGCGDGLIDRMLFAERPDLTIEGMDIVIRPQLMSPVSRFDGRHIPRPEDSFDVVLFLDVLHHTIDPLILLKEAQRVSRKHIIIKDHNIDGFAASQILRFMDWVGNAPHGISLPYNYWPQERWLLTFANLGLTVCEYRSSLGLYSRPGSWLFERSLHFVVQLGVQDN